MNNRWKRLRAALAASVLIAAGTVHAGPPSDGLSLRAVGLFEAESSSGGSTCTVPSAEDGILLNSDQIGLWTTDGQPTTGYPMSACGGWMELQNTMTAQGINIDRVDIRLRIAGAGRFRQFVPTRGGFPTACRNLRKSTIFAGAHLFPLGTDPGFGNTGSGAPWLAFVNLFPMVDAQVIGCLREQYAGLPANVYTSFPLVIRMIASGISDSGQRLKSNAIKFTLTLQHFCGNGRIDASEVCDPNAPDQCDAGTCDTAEGTCRRSAAVFCQTDADCQGRCLQEGDPNECTCLFGE
jgi:hypothetical protein